MGSKTVTVKLFTGSDILQVAVLGKLKWLPKYITHLVGMIKWITTSSGQQKSSKQKMFDT